MSNFLKISVNCFGDSVMREKIGLTSIDPILSDGKSFVEEDA